MRSQTFDTRFDGADIAVPIVAEPSIENLSQVFEETLDAFGQIDEGLSRVGLHVSNARTDRVLQAFWNGVKLDFEAEAHRLALQIGEAAIRLTRTDLRRDSAKVASPGRDTLRPLAHGNHAEVLELVCVSGETQDVNQRAASRVCSTASLGATLAAR